MTKEEKARHVSRYKKVHRQKESEKFQEHVQCFLRNERSDDEVTAEVLDFMYQALGGTIDTKEEVQ